MPPFVGLIFGGAGKFLKSIPWQLWAVAGGVTLFSVGSCMHEKKVDAIVAAADKTGYDRAMEEVRVKSLRDLRLAREAEARINPAIRNQADAENRVTNDRRADLLLRGPGRAACHVNPTVPGSAGGHDSGSGEAGATTAEVPAADRIAVPFDYAVNDEAVDDANLTEVKAWRTWHKSYTEAWAKLASPDK
jgi:hypothetical protein